MAMLGKRLPRIVLCFGNNAFIMSIDKGKDIFVCKSLSSSQKMCNFVARWIPIPHIIYDRNTHYCTSNSAQRRIFNVGNSRYIST